MSNTTSIEHGQQVVDTQPSTLGPDSMLWRYAGDSRIYLMATATGLLLNMLPGVSAGIEQHSSFFTEPWVRTLRSIPQIMETIYDPQMTRRVRDYHQDVKGIDHHGRRYHALSPELYFAAHAVFTYTIITMIDVFDHRLTDAEKRQLYRECKLWYQQYGISDRAMPEDWDGFCVYWDHLCSEVMEDTPVARAIITDVFPSKGTARPPHLPLPVYLVLRPLLADQAMLLTAALLPPAARRTMNLPYSRFDRLRFAAAAALIRNTWPRLPSALRETPRARFGKHRALRLAG
jgi:uncharacterized protein (DUF2236 family)